MSKLLLYTSHVQHILTLQPIRKLLHQQLAVCVVHVRYSVVAHCSVSDLYVSNNNLL